jgi:hypothetical protein
MPTTGRWVVLVQRRTEQISLQLLKHLDLIHAFTTDDAYEIEVYWHRRFAAKHIKSGRDRGVPPCVGLFGGQNRETAGQHLVPASTLGPRAVRRQPVGCKIHTGAGRWGPTATSILLCGTNKFEQLYHREGGSARDR